MPRLVLLCLVWGCSDYKISTVDGDNNGADDTAAGDDQPGDTDPGDGVCSQEPWPAVDVGLTDTCPEPPAGGFTPIVEWSTGSNYNCTALPVVADIDGDGVPEILYNRTDWFSFFGARGTLVAERGDGSGVLWEAAVDMGYGSSPAVADIDADGSPEIFVVREYENPIDITSGSFGGDGDYTVVMLDASGSVQWESEHFIAGDFDYATAVAVSDMDGDGSAEVIAGRVILNAADGTTRGVGALGRGSWGYDPFQILSEFGLEASVSAVVDIDLDGTEEVIVGDALYGPDGTLLWQDTRFDADDGMIAVANLDDDPEGEWIASTNNTVRAHDTDGTLLWGPVTIPSGNILSVPAVADLDLDGMPEIVVAGGNTLMCLNHDGTQLWTAPASDESGATGAAVFDFEGDGQPEVVYIDEQQMAAFDGATGAIKFHSTKHNSATMMDYPVIADVDGDDHAEIVVCHAGYSVAMSVYGDFDNTWASARTVWNQHAYSINNINDDLTLPASPAPAFADGNTWHAGVAGDGSGLIDDLEAEIVEVCTEECGEGVVYVTVRIRNRSEEAVPAGVRGALYARSGGLDTLVGFVVTDAEIPSATSSEGLTMTVDAGLLDGAGALVFVVDDDGYGNGAIDECSEQNNDFVYSDALCD